MSGTDIAGDRELPEFPSAAHRALLAAPGTQIVTARGASSPS